MSGAAHSVPSHHLPGMDGLAVTGTGTYYSDPVTIPYANEVSFQVDYAGNAAGTLTVEVSNYSDNEVRLGTAKWTTYDLVTPPAITTNQNFLLKIKPGTNKVRLKHVNSSGTSTLTVLVSVKA